MSSQYEETKFQYIPDLEKLLTQQNPIVLLAIAVWGEARGEDGEGKTAVASVMMNRIEHRAFQNKQPLLDNIARVVLQPWQFSCFNSNDPNLAKLLSPLDHDSEYAWFACLRAAFMAFYRDNKHWNDPTNGATHYHVKDMAYPPRYFDIAENISTIGNHVFYNLPGEWGYESSN